ncbi:MAG: helix-turn-helix transcriptional regulator [Pseudonocardiaceae bacterium]
MNMAREPEELVEMRRVLGAQLAAYRQAAELSQGQLAIAATVDRTTVAHIEKGRSRADQRFWTIADQRCHADGALLAGFHAWDAAKQDHEVRAREAQLSEARARADTLRATTAPQRCLCHEIASPRGTETPTTSPTAGGTDLAQGSAEPLAYLSMVGSLAGDVPGAGPDELIGRLAKLLCRWVGAMNRRELLHFLGWAASTATALPLVGALNTDEQERLVRAIVSPSRVDERVIDHIDAAIRHCQLQEDALGSRAVLPTLLGQQNLVRELLAECPANLRSRLLSAYSNMSTSIGYYFFELNDVDSARYHHEQARTAAHDADSVELSIYALCEWSYTESWQGRAPTGIDLATVAQSLLSKTEDPLMRVGAAQRAATAYAFDGQYEACMTEIERARDSLDAAAGQVSPESPAYFFNEGYLTSHKSECLLRLGKPREAAASASTGLMLYDKSFVDGYAVCTLHLGNAHLQSGEIDEAARLVGSAADLAAQTRSARLVKELRTTRGHLQPWQSTQAVKTLDDQLAAYGLVTSSSAT